MRNVRGRVLALALILCALPAFGQTKSPRRPNAPTASAPQVRSQVTIKDATFRSAALGREMHYRIILPAGYAETSRRYPVLYLLHGLVGSYIDWENRTHLVRYVEPLQLIVVMPDADDSWYTNSATVAADKYEDYVATDLVDEIDGHYRSIKSGYARAIAGLSMGGYGAVKIALKHPGLVVFAGSFSGALNAATGLEVPLGKAHVDHMNEVFGPADSPARASNDVFALLKKAEDSHFTRLPYFYLDCGETDGFLKTNREFVAQLQRQKIAYEYHEVPGAHMWEYWNQQVQVMLGALVRQMSIAAE